MVGSERGGGGCLRLIAAGDLPPLLAEGVYAGSLELDDLVRNREARELVALVLERHGCSEGLRFRIQLAVAEAVGNVFKHAGRGRLELRRLPDRLRAIVSDQGPGIPSRLLPQAFVVDGVSSTVSLGKGFTLMLHYMDMLMVATGPGGTTLILDKHLSVGAGCHA